MGMWWVDVSSNLALGKTLYPQIPIRLHRLDYQCDIKKMAKIKDALIDEQAFRDKELEASDWKSGYHFDRKNHLHFHTGNPLTGTSSVMDVLSKNLAWWAAELAAIECLESGEKIPTIREEYQKACASHNKKQAIDALQVKYPTFKKARFAHYTAKNDSAKKGTDLHAELERYVKDVIAGKQINRDDYEGQIHPFITWTEKNVARFLWSEMHVFSTKHWLGGISDCGAELKNGEVAIIDFKSSKEAYQSQSWQIAGYDIQVTENGGYDSKGIKMFTLHKPITQHIVVPFGAKIVKPVVFGNVEGNKRAFLGALAVYRETIRN